MKNINELLEALYKESENKDEVIEYVDLLTDYYAKQRELEILQDKIEQIQIYSKNANEIWSMMMSMADAAMKEAEKSQKTGADKKKMVIESVKAGCKSAGLDISNFLDQLDAYIDQTISFVNQMKK